MCCDISSQVALYDVVWWPKDKLVAPKELLSFEVSNTVQAKNQF